MPAELTDIAKLLLDCEETGPAPKYVDASKSPAPIAVASDSAAVFVISDLHLAAGRGPDGTYPGTENFFADASLKRFLEHAHESSQPGKALLIINGDFIDFLRITEGPCSDLDYQEWQATLAEIGRQWTIDELRKSVSPREIRCHTEPQSKIARKVLKTFGISPDGFGLKTNAFKSVWKLAAVVGGHPEFFDALAEWLRKGHKLIVVKGNHDLEWYWLDVRNYLRLALAEKLNLQTGQAIQQELVHTVLPNVTFIDDGLLIDGHFYVEHGHRFDKYTNVQGGPVWGDGQELNIPFGSFMNRYLINFIELDYPYLDNVRPTSSILPLLVRERFPLALKLLFVHLPFMLRVIRKNYWDYMFRRVLVTLGAVLIPVVAVGAFEWPAVKELIGHLTGGSTSSNPIRTALLSFGSSLGGLVFSYFLSRVVAYFQLEEPDSLSKNAREEFVKNPDYRIITFGHTHNPDQTLTNGRWFFNTGTWIPIVEMSSADIREDRTYTVLRLDQGPSGLVPGGLYRWDDEAERLEDAVLVRRKDY
jgi:UDP-2,3-diacylglucosamine pyrophosphatase LpxH